MSHEEERRRLIVEKLDLAGEGIEYGPLHRIIVQKGAARVRYVDYADREYLVRHYSKDQNVDTRKIPDIDIVTGGKPILEFVKPETLQFVVASHVAEHVPDLIGWLESNAAILRRRGRIALAFPDRRFTFDVKRKPSSEADLMAAHFEKRSKPSVAQICDHFWHESRVNPVEAWRINFKPSDAPFVHDRKAIIPILKMKAESGDYTDCHCWIFSDDEFFAVVGSIINMFSIPLEIIDLKWTRPNTTEFYVTLEKRD